MPDVLNPSSETTAGDFAAPSISTSSPTTGEGGSKRCGRPKADGKPCQAWAVRGQEACAGHLGLGIASDPEAYAALSATSRQAQAAERKRTPREIYAAALAEHAEDMSARLIKIALHGEDADALRAIEALNSRVLGKPKETVQQVQEADDLKAIREMSQEERDALYTQLMRAEGVTLP